MLRSSRLLEGDQILHVDSEDRPFWEHPPSKNFVKQHFTHAKALQTDAEVLRYASDSVALDGAFVELGVWEAKTINFIAALNPTKKIYGCDSFEGLPEAWDKGDEILPKGAFAWKKKELPFVLPNVVLAIGWFEETLPEFSRSVLGAAPIAFLHVDCDLYSSTVCGLKYLGKHLEDGSIIVFDDFYNYPNFEKDAVKALNEFLVSSGLKAEFIAYNMFHQQAAVRIRR